MKRSFAIISFFFLIFLSSCEDFSLHNVVLDNQSDYDVTIELYVGNTNDDGSMLFESFFVTSHEKLRVPSETDRVYVDSYSPSGSVSMDIDNPGRITFTNS